MRPDPPAGSRGHSGHDRLRTSCGRELTVGRLALGDARHPAARVFVDLGDCAECAGSGWAGFTVAEARQLARAVLAQAAAAERECQARAHDGAIGRDAGRSEVKVFHPERTVASPLGYLADRRDQRGSSGDLRLSCSRQRSRDPLI